VFAVIVSTAAGGAMRLRTKAQSLLIILRSHSMQTCIVYRLLAGGPDDKDDDRASYYEILYTRRCEYLGNTE